MKEYIVENYKITDDGYQLKIYFKDKDDFGAEFFRELESLTYKENLQKPAPSFLSMFEGEHSSKISLILKILLEENQHLKFYNRVDKELKDE